MGNKKEIELRVRKKNNKTPWAMIEPEYMENLSDQDPRGEERRERADSIRNDQRKEQ